MFYSFNYGKSLILTKIHAEYITHGFTVVWIILNEIFILYFALNTLKNSLETLYSNNIENDPKNSLKVYTVTI